MDVNGNLYGTANGDNVYELMFTGTRWKLKTLYQFSGGADGGGPNNLTYAGASTGALYDGVSNLYGTTYGGGANGRGAAFSLTPVSGKGFWTEQVLYSFCSQTNCIDGKTPYSGSGPVLDAAGNLYTTTAEGGQTDNGTVVELSPGTPWTETVLYSYCQQTNCTDGNTPYDPLLIDSSGNLYGTTTAGGANAGGTVFELTNNAGQFQFSVLYNFCSVGGCTDGYGPYGGLVMDPSGNLLGTTWGGGKAGGGTTFELSSSGFSDLYNFCSKAACSDGGRPCSSVTIGAGGVLFGTTYAGGKHGSGTVFQLTP